MAGSHGTAEAVPYPSYPKKNLIRGSLSEEFMTEGEFQTQLLSLCPSRKASIDQKEETAMDDKLARRDEQRRC